MDLKGLSVKWIEQLGKKSEKLRHLVEDFLRYSAPEDLMTIDSADFTVDELWTLRKFAEGQKALARRIDTARAIQKNPKGAKLNSCKAFYEAVIPLLRNTPNKWVFMEDEAGAVSPYYVCEVNYTAPYREHGHVHPPHTDLKLKTVYLGTKEALSIQARPGDVYGNAVEVLQRLGAYIETPESVKLYQKQIDTYKELSVIEGTQFFATGKGYPLDPDKVATWWKRKEGPREMMRDEKPAKVILDSRDDEGLDNDARNNRETVSYASTHFWLQRATTAKKINAGREVMEEDFESTEESAPTQVLLPVRPYLKVFDLGTHEFAAVHVDNLAEYEYDPSLVDKLILPEADKELISILIWGADEKMEDIISGKSGGVVITTLGPPGVGKTLTAEVLSEGIKRPLYVVQCSQLGLNEEELEANLFTILRRAERWNAILFLDEADVYIRRRGDDLRQNAIIGVFLRLLEYYDGVLFMASNRADVIDDAILSRSTAIIRYKRPTPENLGKIWRVLAKQYRIKLPEAAIPKLVQAMPDISGRNVKNLLKLGRLLAKKRNKKVTSKLLISVAKFSDVEKV